MIRHGTSPTETDNCASEPLLENNEGVPNHQRAKPSVVRNRSSSSTDRSSTPSLRKSSSSISPSRRHIQSTDSTIHPQQANTWCVGMRWVMLGIIIGSSMTGISQSISMPRLCSGVSSEALSTHGYMTPGVHPPEQVVKAVQASKLAKAHSEIQQTKPLILNFTNLPPPPELTVNDTFAACLLIKDDNHWLIEWLAYHHFVMPLRHLVIAIDPGSKTSPNEILSRWSQRNLMKIHIWTDKNFMPLKVNYKPGTYDNNTQLLAHRLRQANFYRKCNAFLRQKGMGWLMLVDTDEYIVPSYASHHFQNLTRQVSSMEPGSVIRLLKYYEQVTGDNQTCVYMPRFFFGAKESEDDRVTSHVSKPIDAFGMVTQRFLFREPSKNTHGKNLVNLKRVMSLQTFQDVHHVSKEACPNPELMRSLDLNKHALLRVHHYLGTKEQYFFRDDPRVFNESYGIKGKVKSYIPRDTKRFDAFTRKATNEDHAAKSWIRGFVKSMGVDLATALLKGVGKVVIEE